MLVSWNWLKEYVPLEMSVEELTDRLTMSGLNLESVRQIGGDTVIDLEVTSNRPDCLGHLGVAREISVLFGLPLTIPQAQPKTTTEKTAAVTSVAIEAPELCSQYVARVIRGVKVGPSPAWLQQRLEALGERPVNNIVDITNYVLLECSQPLHAFDFQLLQGKKIVVRRANKGETLKAIDQKAYELSPEMCVIADAKRPVAIAGVMGGFETEISSTTKDVLIEAAAFAPLSVRATARKLTLHSPSSYRFERALDPLGPEWASRRCCELILELAGGELLSEPIHAGTIPSAKRPAIVFRFAQIRRVLGIEIAPETAVKILQTLGLEITAKSADSCTVVPPSFRRDLEREIDLIEEVARVHGYDKIPADVSVPLRASAKSTRDRVLERVRGVLTGAGYFEAMTPAFVGSADLQRFRPRGELPALSVDHSTRKQENLLRQSLIPSLLGVRRHNERHGNFQTRLFETAKIYLGADPGRPEAEVEPLTIGLVTGTSFLELKGVVELLAGAVCQGVTVTVEPSDCPSFTPGRGAEVLLEGRRWGWLGELDASVIDPFDLAGPVCVAELDWDVLESQADLITKVRPLPQFQGVTRDLNFVLDEALPWANLADAVRQSAGPLLEQIAFGGQYRGKQIPESKKSYVVSLTFRSGQRTLTSEEVDAAVAQVVRVCGESLGAALRA
ncbi:MAG: phenylalanine--tRNA ligase subunit beta [Planctomycetaceae bacterium]